MGPANELFDYSPITERPPITWPGGARVAVYIGLNVEHFLIDRPSTSIWPGTSDRTFHTPALLAELGLGYVLDWTNDDQPYPLNVPGMLSVPYTVELNDLGLFSKGTTGPGFVQIVKDQYEQLHADSEHSGRVMALALHPFVIGQAFRATYLNQALAYLAAQPDIWLTTSDEIAEHYRHTVQPRT